MIVATLISVGRSDGHSLDPLRMGKHLHKHFKAGLALQLREKEQRAADLHGSSCSGVMGKLGKALPAGAASAGLWHLLPWTPSQPWGCGAKTTLGLGKDGFNLFRNTAEISQRRFEPLPEGKWAELRFQNGSCQLKRMI